MKYGHFPLFSKVTYSRNYTTCSAPLPWSGTYSSQVNKLTINPFSLDRNSNCAEFILKSSRCINESWTESLSCSVVNELHNLTLFITVCPEAEKITKLSRRIIHRDAKCFRSIDWWYHHFQHQSSKALKVYRGRNNILNETYKSKSESISQKYEHVWL